MSVKIKIPVLIVLVVVMILAMLRLAIWQLDRASQKQVILDQVMTRSEQAPVTLVELLAEINISSDKYRNVMVEGQLLDEMSIYIDNQVVEGQVGYLVFTPLKIKGVDQAVMVNRGWLSAGLSRERLPEFTTDENMQTFIGRLNIPPAQPPLWDDNYPVAQGKVWAYLPLEEYASQMQLTLLPLVLELQPKQAGVDDTQFKIVRPEINDQWVAKHHGYAFQWLMMAIALFVASCILLLRTTSTSRTDTKHKHTK